jgi:hypothetical protein
MLFLGIAFAKDEVKVEVKGSRLARGLENSNKVKVNAEKESAF